MKQLQERRIETWELETIPEQRNRVFKVSYTVMGGVVLYEKIFQSKRWVKEYINNPKHEKIKVYVGDVVYD